jgi:hypothetical protein
MKIHKHTIRLISRSSIGTRLADHCSGAFLNEITRGALLTVVLATGCTSTGKGFSARLISPATSDQRASDVEENYTYGPARSQHLAIFLGVE